MNKFYNITNLTDTSAEIEVYGEIVENRPKSWWSGKPIDGLFFVSKEFNEQMEMLKNVKNITVKINSPGGDLFVGVGVYNKLKQLDAEITVIVEGLAASAAGLIACAGDTVKLGTGAMIMAHQASTFIPDWYMNETDADEYKNKLSACNKVVAEIISAKTGKSADEIHQLLKEGEIWKSGQEAIDFGFADEMLNADEQTASAPYIDSTNNVINSNGRIFPIANYLGNASQHIETMHNNTVNSSDNGDETEKYKEDKAMTITVDTLRKDHPEIVQQIEETAKNEALVAERQRQKEIDGIAHLISDKAVLDKAKYGDGDDAVSAKDLLWNVAQSQKGKGADFLAQVKSDSTASGIEGVEANPEGEKSDEEKVADELNSAMELFNSKKG